MIGSGEWRMAGPADFVTNLVEPFGSPNLHTTDKKLLLMKKTLASLMKGDDINLYTND